MPADLRRLGGVVPALQRAGRRLRPCRADDPGDTRRRPLGDLGPEGVELDGDGRRLRHAPRPHRLRRAQARGDLVVRVRARPARRDHPAAGRDHRARACSTRCSSTTRSSPDADLIGGLNNGWAVTKTTLMFERAGIGAGGTMSGFPPPGAKGGFLELRAGDAAALRPPRRRSKVLTVDELFELARTHGRDRDPLIRQKLARLVEHVRTGEWTAKRSVAEMARGGGAGLANVGKLAQTRIAKLSTEVACEIVGPHATLWPPRRPARGPLRRSPRVRGRLVDLRGNRPDPAQCHRRAGARAPEGTRPEQGTRVSRGAGARARRRRALTARHFEIEEEETPMGVVARAHDLLVNTDMGDLKQPEWMVRVKEDYFKAGQSMFTSRELPELLDEMDGMGVERAVLMANLGRPSDRVLSFVDARPRPLQHRHRWSQPPAPDADPARARELRRRPPGRVHRRSARLLGRRHVPAGRRGLLPALHEVLRARPAAVHEHRPARPADPG